jgi:allophanate hydrolase subunit 2
METLNSNDVVFLISKADLQHEAQKKIGRKLNFEEIEIARKGLQFGLLTDIETIYRTIFFEMINQ